jgi:putative ABC transport system substrate-binding protein
MRRREFSTLLGAAAAASVAWPSVLDAQQKAMPVIGMLIREGMKDRFRQDMQALGYVEGKTVRFEFRPLTPASALPRFADELVKLKVDIIIAAGSEAVRAAQRATQTTPIVTTGSSDPVGTGFAASLARPGGNITGMSLSSSELTGKRLELLKEAVGSLSRIVALWNPDDPPAVLSLKETEAASQVLGIGVRAVEVRRPEDFDAAFAAAIGHQPDAVVVLSAPLMSDNVARIAAWAKQNRLPSMFWSRTFPAAGGLMSYGPNQDDLVRGAAVYVYKILKGAKPGDLPIVQPSTFELVINIPTAKALGITIPPSILSRADEVIE